MSNNERQASGAPDLRLLGSGEGKVARWIRGLKGQGIATLASVENQPPHPRFIWARSHRRWIARLAWVLGFWILWGAGRMHSQPSAENGTTHLGLGDFLKLVLERNESVQVRLLELEVNRRKYRAEKGVFEPELSGSFSREANRRENTALEQLSELGATLFDERNNIYQGGLQGLVPSGARVQLGYTLHDLRNNLQDPRVGTIFTNPIGHEYQTFAGVSVTQPLLKNAWFPATLAGVRLAALSSDIAFQDYRRQMMLILSTAEAAYWNLYMAQEQVRFFQQSVATAQKILDDTRARQLAGKSAELDVLETEAGLALRRTKLSEAEEKLYEAADKVLTLYSETAVATNRLMRAADHPQLTAEAPSLLEAWQTAFRCNPDYLMQRQKLMQEYVRVSYARNQRLPELDLKGSYGLNGLGDSPSASWREIELAGFPSWSVGVELRLPLAGGIKSANELAAARLRQKEAELNLKEMETQVVNGLDTALHKLKSAREIAHNYQKVVDFNQNLLDSALDRLEVGRLEGQKVLEIEADLFEAKNSQVEAVVNCQRALLELEFMEGCILRRRQIEMSQTELQTRTAALIRRRGLDGEQYQRFIKEMQAAYETKRLAPLPADTPDQKKAREALSRRWQEQDKTNSPSIHTNSEAEEDPIRSLRKKREELQ
ncbi:MAG: TolC family protein [Verrucomicrobiota bacterium]|jgi:outer membrane protein TolC